MLIWYKNSTLASLVSLAGCVMVLVCFGIANSNETVATVLLFPGIALVIAGKLISMDKAFKDWWKQVEDNHLEPAIAASVDVAVAIYNKNPRKRTLKKIAELNPSAAEAIKKMPKPKKK